MATYTITSMRFLNLVNQDGACESCGYSDNPNGGSGDALESAWRLMDNPSPQTVAEKAFVAKIGYANKGEMYCDTCMEKAFEDAMELNLPTDYHDGLYMVEVTASRAEKVMKEIEPLSEGLGPS